MYIFTALLSLTTGEILPRSQSAFLRGRDGKCNWVPSFPEYNLPRSQTRKHPFRLKGNIPFTEFFLTTPYDKPRVKRKRHSLNIFAKVEHNIYSYFIKNLSCFGIFLSEKKLKKTPLITWSFFFFFSEPQCPNSSKKKALNFSKCRFKGLCVWITFFPLKAN